MQVFFIEESLNINKLFFWKKKIIVEEDKVRINQNGRNTKIIKQIINILKSYNCNTVIIDNKLKENTNFVNSLYANNIDIIKGRILFKYLICQIIDKKLRDKNLLKQNLKLSIAVNESDRITRKTIEEISKDYRSINIVTNNINQFSYFCEKKLEQTGTIIPVTNNKKKSLAKSDIILNIDFPEDTINKYIINEKSIIFNLEENIKIKKKRFCGEIINDYNIRLKEESNIYNELIQEKYKLYDIKDLAECYIINMPDEIKNILVS